MNVRLQTLTDQVATLAVSLDRLIQTVERSERVAQQNANTIAEQSRTVNELVAMVRQMMHERNQ